MLKPRQLNSGTVFSGGNSARAKAARRALGWASFALGLLCSVVAARAEYQVEAGDWIEISVARVPELQRRVPVKPDGSITFPLLGTMATAGLTPSEIQAKIQVTFATKIFRQRAPDGRESAVAIDPDEVTVTVTYRPVYVNGDVSKPGEQAFRPFMTARQAIALSGGYDMLRGRMDNPFLLSADLRSDYESLWLEFAKEQARLTRLRSELGERDDPNQMPLAGLPIPQSLLAEITGVETDHLKTAQADYRREKAFLEYSVKQAEQQIVILSDQEKKEEQGTQADTEELQKVLELYGRGSLPSLRVTDARRALLLSSTRKLQTAAQLMQIKRQQDDYSRQLERLDDQRRMRLLQDLQDTRIRLGAIRAKLQGIGEKLQYTGVMKSELTRGSSVKPHLLVLRKGAKGWERSVVEEDSELQPGDIVEVSLPAPYPVSLAGH